MGCIDDTVMKKLLPIIAVLMCTVSPLSATWTLVQSKAGGSATGSGLSYPFNLTSSAVGFNSTTTAGDLWVCVAWNTTTQTTGSGSAEGGVFNRPVTSGVTWRQPSSFENGWNATPNNYEGTVAVFYSYNTPSISSSTTTMIEAEWSGTSGPDFSATIEFTLYEFSGALTTSSIVDAVTFNSLGGDPGGVSPIPTCSFANGNEITTTGSDLVVCAFSGQGSNITSGSGMTLGINAAVATVGQMQYLINSPTGGIPTAFTGDQTYWASLGVAFKPGASTVTVVPRHRGFVN
jgi:hypothetical protein